MATADGRDVPRVLRYPDPALRRPGRIVAVEELPLSSDVLATLVDALFRHGGVAIAANQVGVDLRVFVGHPDVFGTSGTVFVNPTITWRSDATDVADEGCLSFPGVVLPVRRNVGVVVAAWSADGTSSTVGLDGLASRAAQHEVDHLDGVLIVDHVSDRVRHRVLAAVTRGG